LSSRSLPPEVERLISGHFDSAEQLDILLLLHGQPERQWVATEVSKAIFSVPTSATRRLKELVAAGFLLSMGEGDPRYWYSPESESLRVQVDALAAAYRADRVAVINRIFQKPTDPVKSFANAFRLRREE
jgi:hypothetical protein